MINIDINRTESDIVKHLRDMVKECENGLIIEPMHVAWILAKAADEIDELRIQVVDYKSAT